MRVSSPRSHDNNDGGDNNNNDMWHMKQICFSAGCAYAKDGRLR